MAADSVVFVLLIWAFFLTPVFLVTLAFFSIVRMLAWVHDTYERHTVGRLARRLQDRICVHCGYDLRASLEKCPECGQPVPKKVL